MTYTIFIINITELFRSIRRSIGNPRISQNKKPSPHLLEPLLKPLSQLTIIKPSGAQVHRDNSAHTRESPISHTCKEEACINLQTTFKAHRTVELGSTRKDSKTYLRLAFQI